MMFGLIPDGLTFYMASEIALSSTVIRQIAFGLAAIPFLLVFVLFKKRK
jgi:hypothetical protein